MRTRRARFDCAGAGGAATSRRGSVLAGSAGAVDQAKSLIGGASGFYGRTDDDRRRRYPGGDIARATVRRPHADGIGSTQITVAARSCRPIRALGTAARRCAAAIAPSTASHRASPGRRSPAPSTCCRVHRPGDFGCRHHVPGRSGLRSDDPNYNDQDYWEAAYAAALARR